MMAIDLFMLVINWSGEYSVNVPLNADGWIAFDLDGRYLTLFLDEPGLNQRGRWTINAPATRSIVIQDVGNDAIIFILGENSLSAGEKLKFTGLEIA